MISDDCRWCGLAMEWDSYARLWRSTVDGRRTCIDLDTPHFPVDRQSEPWDSVRVPDEPEPARRKP